MQRRNGPEGELTELKHLEDARRRTFGGRSGFPRASYVLTVGLGQGLHDASHDVSAVLLVRGKSNAVILLVEF